MDWAANTGMSLGRPLDSLNLMAISQRLAALTKFVLTSFFTGKKYLNFGIEIVNRIGHDKLARCYAKPWAMLGVLRQGHQTRDGPPVIQAKPRLSRFQKHAGQGV